MLRAGVLFLWVGPSGTVVETLVLVKSLCEYNNLGVCVYSTYVRLLIKSTSHFANMQLEIIGSSLSNLVQSGHKS